MSQTTMPCHVHYHRADRQLELIYPPQSSHGQPPAVIDEEGQDHFFLAIELLRVHSPSAEVQGHAPEQAILQTGKRSVGLTDITPVGRYSLKLHFDDGHASGLFTWPYLYHLACHQATLWASYLEALDAAGASREPQAIFTRAR